MNEHIHTVLSVTNSTCAIPQPGKQLWCQLPRMITWCIQYGNLFPGTLKNVSRFISQQSHCKQQEYFRPPTALHQNSDLLSARWKPSDKPASIGKFKELYYEIYDKSTNWSSHCALNLSGRWDRQRNKTVQAMPLTWTPSKLVVLAKLTLIGKKLVGFPPGVANSKEPDEFDWSTRGICHINALLS